MMTLTGLATAVIEICPFVDVSCFSGFRWLAPAKSTKTQKRNDYKKKKTHPPTPTLSSATPAMNFPGVALNRVWGVGGFFAHHHLSRLAKLEGNHFR